MRSGWALIWALAIAQLVSWGSLYYSFSLFVVPMEAELGWSRTTLDGALSLGLLVAGLLAYPVGAWIDRHGGRAVMSLGSLSGAALLWAWSSTRCSRSPSRKLRHNCLTISTVASHPR